MNRSTLRWSLLLSSLLAGAVQAAQAGDSLPPTLRRLADRMHYVAREQGKKEDFRKVLAEQLATLSTCHAPTAQQYEQRLLKQAGMLDKGDQGGELWSDVADTAAQQQAGVRALLRLLEKQYNDHLALAKQAGNRH